MTDLQAQNIIENCLKAHWPYWDFKGQEYVVWVQELRKFDHDTAKTAIDELYKGWNSNRYPKMPQIMAAIRTESKRNREPVECVAVFTIEREDGRQRWNPFWGNPRIPRPELERRAEVLVNEANRMHPNDRHIICWHVDEDGNSLNANKEQYYGPDAKERAFGAILNGPDTKTRRWLERYVNRHKKHTKSGSAREEAIEAGIENRRPAIPIGDVYSDEVPF